MLIKCPECGKQISDTAKECLHCGFKFKKCDECGNIVSLNDDSCNQCGFQFTVKSKKSKTKTKSAGEKLFKEEEKKARKVAAYIEKLNAIFKWGARIANIIPIPINIIAIIAIIK